MGVIPWQCRSSAVAVPWSRGGEPALEEQWGGLKQRPPLPDLPGRARKPATGEAVTENHKRNTQKLMDSWLNEWAEWAQYKKPRNEHWYL